MPGMAGMPGLNEILSHPEVLTAMRDPEVMVAFQDVAQNPANMSKYQSNPKVMNLIGKLSAKFGGRRFKVQKTRFRREAGQGPLTPVALEQQEKDAVSLGQRKLGTYPCPATLSPNTCQLQLSRDSPAALNLSFPAGYIRFPPGVLPESEIAGG
ncbi:hypothetical protein GH733_000806 [Mirounga leonina]|nr:hypothetical protein GH733_000806 [Mirounga leonina]